MLKAFGVALYVVQEDKYTVDEEYIGVTESPSWFRPCTATSASEDELPRHSALAYRCHRPAMAVVFVWRRMTVADVRSGHFRSTGVGMWIARVMRCQQMMRRFCLNVLFSPVLKHGLRSVSNEQR